MKKTVVIDNYKKLNKFYKLLPLYNSILFKFVDFEICGYENNEINLIKSVLKEKTGEKSWSL